MLKVFTHYITQLIAFKTAALGRRCGSPLVWPEKGCTPTSLKKSTGWWDGTFIWPKWASFTLTDEHSTQNSTTNKHDLHKPRREHETEICTTMYNKRWARVARRAVLSRFQKLDGSRGDKEKAVRACGSVLLLFQRYSWYWLAGYPEELEFPSKNVGTA